MRIMFNQFKGIHQETKIEREKLKFSIIKHEHKLLKKALKGIKNA